MTVDGEAIVRHAYHTAEGNVLDVQGFTDPTGARDYRRSRRAPR